MDNPSNTQTARVLESGVHNSKTLTVVVLDEKSQPIQGSKVSITPSNASAITNSSGEVQFTLGSATKYDVTATAGGKTVTVPYYVTQNGATRLIVNPVYVQSVESQLQPSLFRSGIISHIAIGLGILIVLLIIFRLFRRSK